MPHLKDRLVVFTSRKAPSQYYDSFVAAGIKLDIRTLSASDVITLALSPEKQDQQNVAKLRALRGQNWSDLVDLIHDDGNSADVNEIKRLLNANDMSDVEVFAARANMTRIIGMLHDPASRLMDALLTALKDGKLCVVDVSQLRGGPSLILSGLILRRIFDRNQEEFTKDNPQSIPTIAVVEEAQSVLNERSSAAQPYIEWVKEGRKYDLGALLITQQPGSIPGEILSQGDNWFIFHLLSASDLRCVKAANAHYSDDLLSSLLNEPIPGHGVFWSSVSGRPFPISFRPMLFEKLYTTADPQYGTAGVNTYASQLRQRLHGEVQQVLQAAATTGEKSEGDSEEDESNSEPVDFRKLAKQQAIEELRKDTSFMGISTAAFRGVSFSRNLRMRCRKQFKIGTISPMPRFPKRWSRLSVPRMSRGTQYVERPSPQAEKRLLSSEGQILTPRQRRNRAPVAASCQRAETGLPVSCQYWHRQPRQWSSDATLTHQVTPSTERCGRRCDH